MMKILQAKFSPILLVIFVTFVCVLAFQAGLFAGFEYFLGDQLLDPIGASEEIVIVAIDDESIGKIGQWPWPREEYAKLLNVLSKNPPKVVGIDVLFAEPSRVGKNDDQKLVDVLTKIKFPVVLASREGVPPIPKFTGIKGSVLSGDVSLLVDADGVVRRAKISDSFAILIHFWSKPEETPTDVSEIPRRISFAGPPGIFRRVPFWRVLENPELGITLKDRIVLVGATATDLHDEQITAIERGNAMPGVEIQANLVNALTKNIFVDEVSFFSKIFLILISAFLPAFLFMFLSGMWRPITGSLIVFVIMFISLIIAWGENMALPIFYPSLAWFFSTASQVLYRYFGTEKSRREIKSLFGKYVSRDVLEEILRNPSAVKLGGEEREVSVLFSDVRGFTTLSESMGPTELTKFLNRYLSRMTDIILNHGGGVDKYIGDAIMCFWGAPVTNEGHAKNALVAACAMSEALDGFNKESEQMGAPKIEIGIGINSGLAVAGNMGSAQRFDYTLMGDTVNTASRLEGLTKNYGVRVIVSGSVIAATGGGDALIQKGIITREIDRVRAKGKTEAVTLYEVMTTERASGIGKILQRFNSAREYYYVGDWDKCLKLLGEIESLLPNDGPTRVLRERCLQFKITAPLNWQGIYEHKSK